MREVWHIYAGLPLVLDMPGCRCPIRRMMLGPDIAIGEQPHGVVPAGHWQAADSLGDLDTGEAAWSRRDSNFCDLRDGAEGLGRQALVLAQIMSFAASTPPPAISSAATASARLEAA